MNQVPPQNPGWLWNSTTRARLSEPALPGLVHPEKNREHRERHRELVGDQLRRGAHAPKERVLRVGGPSGKDQGVDAERGHREHRKDPDVDVGEHDRDHATGLVEIGAKRHHGHGREGRYHRDEGREDKVELMDVVRERLLLEEELAAVGGQLEEAEALQDTGAGDPREHRRDRPVRARGGAGSTPRPCARPWSTRRQPGK